MKSFKNYSKKKLENEVTIVQGFQRKNILIFVKMINQ